ncbi:MAG: ribonuclease J [Hyphomicrobiales bacterium]|nr:ribonuclease J [Hyphomicrobiales bacterium]
MARGNEELVFAPLGGAGEIGMNLSLYGFGPARSRKWIAVDLGVAFADERQPGIEVIMPDTRFLEDERHNLLAILLTHAHEDHLGAVIDLWPRLQAPVYATSFAAGLLRAKMLEHLAHPGPPVPVHEVPLGATLSLGPFTVEYVTVTHSIPEPNGLVITVPGASVYHTGDWKIDPTPQIGAPTDVARLKALGQEGCRAIICDSTNALRAGVSPSEGDVYETLKRLIAGAPARVIVTAFASNVARLRSAARAAVAAGRRVVVVGRALDRIIAIAQETGYLNDVGEFLSEQDFGHLRREEVVALVTGSQGEPNAALARIAFNEYRNVELAKGDRVIFSSRTIPGNEKAVGRVQNALARAGIEIVTDADDLVHVSGHPRIGELEQMYQWLQPQAAIPVHGEALHLQAHARIAARLGVKEVVTAYNGDLVRLWPAPAEKIDELPSGRLHRDGRIIVREDDDSLRLRRRLGFVGFIGVSVVVTAKGELVAPPEARLIGIPDADAEGRSVHDLVLDAIDGAIDSIPKARRKDPELIETAVRRSARAAVAEAWGKRPVCEVLVTQV